MAHHINQYNYYTYVVIVNSGNKVATYACRMCANLGFLTTVDLYMYTLLNLWNIECIKITFRWYYYGVQTWGI